jgi:hypothetical protein
MNLGAAKPSQRLPEPVFTTDDSAKSLIETTYVGKIKNL